jgi:hypothetical protein
MDGHVGSDHEIYVFLRRQESIASEAHIRKESIVGRFRHGHLLGHHSHNISVIQRLRGRNSGIDE